MDQSVVIIIGDFNHYIYTPPKCHTRRKWGWVARELVIWRRRKIQEKKNNNNVNWRENGSHVWNVPRGGAGVVVRETTLTARARWRAEINEEEAGVALTISAAAVTIETLTIIKQTSHLKILNLIFCYEHQTEKKVDDSLRSCFC